MGGCDLTLRSSRAETGPTVNANSGRPAWCARSGECNKSKVLAEGCEDVNAAIRLNNQSLHGGG